MNADWLRGVNVATVVVKKVDTVLVKTHKVKETFCADKGASTRAKEAEEDANCASDNVFYFVSINCFVNIVLLHRSLHYYSYL